MLNLNNKNTDTIKEISIQDCNLHDLEYYSFCNNTYDQNIENGKIEFYKISYPEDLSSLSEISDIRRTNMRYISSGITSEYCLRDSIFENMEERNNFNDNIGNIEEDDYFEEEFEEEDYDYEFDYDDDDFEDEFD